MAEVAGLVVGVVALATVFKDCVDLFLYLDSTRHSDREYQILATKLDVERTLLLQWAERVGLTRRTQYDERLDHESTRKTVLQILQNLRDLLSQRDALQARYGVSQATKQPDFLQALESDFPDDLRFSVELDRSNDELPRDVMASLSGPGIKDFTNQFQRMTVGDGVTRKGMSGLTKVRWSISGKDKFLNLIQELSYFTSKLNELVPDHGSQTSAMMERDLKRLGFKSLKLVCDATTDTHTGMARTASDVIASNCRRRILDRLWFRLIDDRRISIKPALSSTLKWALQSNGTSTTDGGSLHDWLRSGEGIYWVSGKAGSGKSTLMKHLYEEEKTLELLKEWAGSCTLTKANFFFWGLGSDEQKTLPGLSRAVLLSILQSRPDLIATLLPGMWKDAQQSEDAVLDVPSKAEVESAIRALHAEMTTTSHGEFKFCFFIDGLDEYFGNCTEGIEFVQKIARIPNFKVLVASRPIPACVDAFSRAKKLQLQDFTRADIEAYVQATVGVHGQMKVLSEANREGAASLLQDIVKKASGVFLWVILACRSVLEGLAACDFLPELQQRVNDLPPELEDLFRHMLGRGDRRYQEQGAKLLHICYENQLNRNSLQIPTLGLALADEQGFEVGRFVDCEGIRRKEVRRKCQVFEGRLRSRCCGLLEVRYAHPTGHRDYCWCETPGNHDVMMDSTVVFMHRTVYEFLRGQMAGGVQWLDINDKTFDAQLVLAWILLHIVQRSKRLFAKGKQSQLDDAMSAFLVNALRADEALKDGIIAIFGEFGEQIEKVARQGNAARQFLSTYWKCDLDNASRDSQSGLRIAYLLAAQTGMAHFISTTFTPDEDVDIALDQLTRLRHLTLDLRDERFKLIRNHLINLKHKITTATVEGKPTRRKRYRGPPSGADVKRARTGEAPEDAERNQVIDRLLLHELEKVT